MNEAINVTLLLLVVGFASEHLLVWLSRNALRNLSNYCLSREAGLEAYEQAFHSTRVKPARARKQNTAEAN